MAKPTDFYVGVLDFFAILIPGAIATAILAHKYSHVVVGAIIDLPTSEPAQWALFLIFSYFFGHIIFLLGSYLDPLYNWLRERRNPYGNESAYQCATRIRDSVVGDDERLALNTFQWARSVLLFSCPAAAEDIHRLEADSKFFRSLIIVCLISTMTFMTNGDSAKALAACILIIPCFSRYYERRLKSTTQAYIHVLTLRRLNALDLLKQAECGSKPAEDNR